MRRRGGFARASVAPRRRPTRCGRGGVELLVVLAEFVERRLERGVELHVVERECDLAAELGEHAIVFVGEGLAVGAPLAHQQAEAVAGVRVV